MRPRIQGGGVAKHALSRGSGATPLGFERGQPIGAWHSLTLPQMHIPLALDDVQQLLASSCRELRRCGLFRMVGDGAIVADLARIDELVHAIAPSPAPLAAWAWFA